MATSNTRRMMFEVNGALAPGAIVLTWFFGAGIVVNLALCVATCVATEALVLKLRNRPLHSATDGSAILTGILLGLCLPPTAPFWAPVVGSFAAILLGKQLYGGLGHNPFNPAMAGYAVIIVSFPVVATGWPAPGAAPDLASLVANKTCMATLDGFTAATPLDAFRFRGGQTVDEYLSIVQGLNAWLAINAAFLAGGVWLLYRKIINWVLPAAMLGTMIVLATLFYDSGSSTSLGSPLFHLTTGATMLAAFFIVTDPVSSPDGLWPMVVFGAGVGAICFMLRSAGAYPDGFAFAVLLMNMTTPMLEMLRWRIA